jgi:5'-nucleotidase / UDP-sugar diphosphatase
MKLSYKKYLLMLLPLFVAFGCSDSDFLGDDDTTPAARKPIVILHDNDVHCKYADGYMAMDGLRNAMSDTAWVATVSVGDFVQGLAAGAVSNGRYMLRIMEPMAYDAVTIGNHEFDYSIDTLHALLPTGRDAGRQALNAMPVTCANYYNTAADTLVYAPYIMRRYGDRSIAYIGLVTPSTLTSEAYAFSDSLGNALPYSIADGEQLVSRVQTAVDEARSSGADYVIVLSHLGDKEGQTYMNTQQLVAATTGIDAVLDGHTHLVYTRQTANRDGKLIPVSQTGTQFANIGKLYISPTGEIVQEMIPIAEAVAYKDKASREVAAAVDEVNNRMAELENDIVATAPFDLTVYDDDNTWLTGRDETNIGDLVTDAFRLYGQSDIALQSAGAIRHAISAGNISTNDIISALPFFNEMRKVAVTGAQLQTLLNNCCNMLPIVSNYFMQASGLKYTVHYTATPSVTAADIQVLNSSTDQYEPLDLQKTYTLTASLYVINGTEYGSVISSAPVVEYLSKTECEVLKWYLKERLHGTVPETYRQPQDRITVEP